MSWLGVGAIVVVALWLAVLTVSLMLCVRQMAIQRVRLELLVRGGAGSGTGPTLGFSLAPALLESRQEFSRDRTLVVVLSGNCANCAQVMREWEEGEGPSLVSPEGILILLTGQEGAPSDDAARRLAHLGEVVREPESSRLAQALSLTYRPSALLLESGLITGTAVLEHAREMDDLLADSAGGFRSADQLIERVER